jgi:DNA helicase HerA-like ATPase
MSDEALLIGAGSAPSRLLLRYANRHGLVAGATGTGKTITVQGLAEGFSAAGVPVVVADVKGDLSGIAMPGSESARISQRWQQIGLPVPPFAGAPVRIWDVHGESGVALRLSISELGPQMLARMLELNETQEAVLSLVFRFADDEGLLLLDLADLGTTLVHLADNAKDMGSRYAAFSRPSVAAIQRRLLLLEEAGGTRFFGEPAVQLADLLRQAPDGRGIVNLLDARKLVSQPRLYSSFLLWLLSELYETLPEVGDADRPKIAFFFDEAHLLFSDAPKSLRERVEQVVRLIRSRGVGIYFISQSPGDIPDAVLAQLGNRIQHALRAYTPGEQKAVRVAADAFRANPAFETRSVIGELAVGEALVSTLDAGGVPTMVERVLVRPPSSRMGPLADAERAALLNEDLLYARYRDAHDPVSAHEVLSQRAAVAVGPEHPGASTPPPAIRVPRDDAPVSRPAPRGRQRESVGEALVKSVARAVGSSLGRSIVRGVLGSILRGR